MTDKTIKIHTLCVFNQSNMKAIDIIKHRNPCSPAVEWLGDRTMAQAWAECHRGDWMLWLYWRAANYDKRKAVYVAALCANDVRHLMTDPRSTAAVDVALAYGRGEATDEELDAAWAAARASAWASAWAYARAAARAAAVAAARDAAWAASMQRYADFCREHLPVPEINPPAGERRDDE